MSEDSPVLLVGGGGFIGRALAASLIEDGRAVHILSRRIQPNPPAGAVWHVGDQGDQAVLRPLLERCGQVVHLAAATTPGDTVWNPRAELELNLLGSMGFIECLQDFPASKLLFLSSGGSLYGNIDQADEDIVPLPGSYHGAAKLALEAFVSVLAQRRSGAVTIVRPSNIYGPGQRLKQGFGVIRTLLEKARDSSEVTIWGDGSAVRDYLYIDDMVAACRCALDGPAGVYNVGAGTGTSLRTLIALIGEVTGKVLNVTYHPARASDVASIVLNVQKAKQILGWEAMVPLQEGIARTWRELL